MQPLPRLAPRHWLWLLLAIGALLRLALWHGGYGAVAYPDFATYLSAARDLVSGDFSLSQGRRTPGFPLLIALIGEAPRHIVAAQMLIGLAISALLWRVVVAMTGRPGFAFVVGLTYSLNLQQLFLETTLLSETLSTLSVLAAVWTLLAALDRLRAGRPAFGMLAATGIAAGAAILVRPQFVFLPLLVPLLVVYATGGVRVPSRAAVGAAAVAALPACLMVLGWCAVVQQKTGHFTLSTQSGFGLVNHTIGFLEAVPDRYATIRGILIRHRAQRIALVGHDRNTIWYALPEIRQATGMTLPEASREVQKMSFATFARVPGRYVASVAHAWIDFWTVPIFWEPGRLEPSGAAAPLAVLWKVEHPLLRATNLVFVLLVAAAAVSPRARRRLQWDLGATAIAAVVLLSSLIQAMADQGASSRYAVTIQALVVAVVMVCALRARAAASASAAPVPAPALPHLSRS